MSRLYLDAGTDSVGKRTARAHKWIHVRFGYDPSDHTKKVIVHCVPDTLHGEDELRCTIMDQEEREVGEIITRNGEVIVKQIDIDEDDRSDVPWQYP